MDKPFYGWWERAPEKDSGKRHIRLRVWTGRRYRTTGTWLEYFPRLKVWRLRQIRGAEHSNPRLMQRVVTLFEYPDTLPLETVQQLCETSLSLNPELLD